MCSKLQVQSDEVVSSKTVLETVNLPADTYFFTLCSTRYNLEDA